MRTGCAAGFTFPDQTAQVTGDVPESFGTVTHGPFSLRGRGLVGKAEDGPGPPEEVFMEPIVRQSAAHVIMSVNQSEIRAGNFHVWH